jgi:hypothetical protein
MNNSLEIKLKEEKEPTIWERFVQWLDGDEAQPGRPVMQVPKIGTNTEILLSQTQKIKLTNAFEAPDERTSETSFARKEETEQDSSQLFI